MQPIFLKKLISLIQDHLKIISEIGNNLMSILRAQESRVEAFLLTWPKRSPKKAEPIAVIFEMIRGCDLSQPLINTSLWACHL